MNFVPVDSADQPMDNVPEFLKTAPRHLFFTGKGGVGKTSLACASAVFLAEKGRRVLLVSTDPASNLDAVLGTALDNEPMPVTGVAELMTMNIDPEEAARDYRERTLEAAKTSQSPEQIALLQEELQSPCYEELAVFQAFAHTVMSARKGIVVIDTAPTGHTLLLLDTTGAYHRQIMQQAQTESVRVRTPLMLLQDTDYTKILIVALPETTPVLEAASLQEYLRRADIEPFAWIMNASLAAARSSDPIPGGRAAAELDRFEEVLSQYAKRVACIPFQAEEPLGVKRLLDLSDRRTS